MSVTPFDTVWDPSKLINNIHSVLATCGSLLVVDEEQGTVQFIHPSVEQFLIGNFGVRGEFQFAKEDADSEMIQTLLTYLNYDIFDRQISTTVAPSLPAQQVQERILGSIAVPSSARSRALHLLRSRKQPQFDVGRALATHALQFRKPDQDAFVFYEYAKRHTVEHTKELATHSGVLLAMLQSLLRKRKLSMKCLPTGPKTTRLALQTAHSRSLLSTGPRLAKVALQIPRIRSLLPKAKGVGRLNDLADWAVTYGHLGVFRCQLRDARTGLQNLCHLGLLLARLDWDFLRTIRGGIHPQFLLKTISIAAVFQAGNFTSRQLVNFEREVSWDDMVRETFWIAENSMILIFIVVTKRKWTTQRHPVLRTRRRIPVHHEPR